MSFTPRGLTFAGAKTSPETRAAEAKLHAAVARGATNRAMDRLRVLWHLSMLADDGIVKSLEHRSNGTRRPYLLTAKGSRGERAYSIPELEAFVHGADAARGL